MEGEQKTQKDVFLPEIEMCKLASTLQTPFYLYDEARIRASCSRMNEAFSWVSGFRNYFAVKATPTPEILRIVKESGQGVDCSSMSELVLAERAGFFGDEIFFTSNNTPFQEYKKAFELGAIVNLDGVSHIDFLQYHNVTLRNRISFRFNPGSLRKGNSIIGDPLNSKFGMTREQIFSGIRKCLDLGVKEFAIHTMVISNCLKEEEIFQNAEMMFDLAEEILERTGVKVFAVNLGGGIGIPYREEEKPFDVEFLSRKIKTLYEKRISKKLQFKIVFECGRYITGPAGILVARAIHKKTTYKNFLGVDACMANLMRPSLYNAYHHISIVRDSGLQSYVKLESSREGSSVPENGVYDVVGSLCENNDKLATDRDLGPVEIGDLVIFHDVGAHGHCMGFNYNGKLRCAEYLKKADGRIVIIRRAETLDDYFATLI